MKKVFAILLMFVFITSVFSISLYANGDDDEDDMHESMEEIREKMHENEWLIKKQERYENGEKVRLEKREVIKERLEKIKLETDSNKDRIKNIKLEFEDAKLKFKDTKERVLECKNKRSDICKNINLESLTDARTFLIKAADLVIEELKKIKLRIESSSDLTDEEAEDIIEDIDAKIKEIEAIKLRLQSAQSREDVLSAAKDLKKALENVKIRAKLHVEKLRHARVGLIIERAEHLELKLNRILSKFGESNTTNTTELQSLINQFHDKIDDAREKYYKAQDLFDQAKEVRGNTTRGNLTQSDKEQAHALLREAHQNLVDAQKLLKEAHQILQQIFRIVKGISPKELEEDKEDCEQNRPDYVPGKDLGYFIWQSTCDDATWHIEWSGNLKNANLSNTTMHQINGTITVTNVTNDTFFRVRSKFFEDTDKFEVLDNGTKISFTAKVGPSFDGLSFRTTSNKVNFDLYLDNVRDTNLVFIGDNATHPSSIPFELTGEVAEP